MSKGKIIFVLIVLVLGVTLAVLAFDFVSIENIPYKSDKIGGY